MIDFANEKTASDVRTMWKICFGDTEQFIDLYFSNKYRDENTLIYFENNVAVASLQMLPCKIRFYGEVITFYYLAGLCTLPEYRNKGYMRYLIEKAYKVMHERSIPLSILIPAEDWLYNYYAKFGFETTFEKGIESIDLKLLLNKYQNDIDEAYSEFDAKYQRNDFCVLKNLSEFECIVQDSEQEDFPIKYNLAGMSAIIDSKILLELYAKKHSSKSFSIKINNETSNIYTIYSLREGYVKEIDSLKGQFDFEVTSRMLIRLLFGFNTDLLPEKYFSYFEKHNPIMNLMLE